jgi:hypothetical protein
MAVTPAARRASALGVGLVFALFVIPDGAISQADRQTIAHSYLGTGSSVLGVRLSTRPPAPTGIDPTTVVWLERDSGGGTYITEETTVGNLLAFSYTSQVDTYTAVAGDRILPENSSASLTIDLPATPSTDDTVVFKQVLDQPYSVNNLIVGRSGSTIMGVAEDTTVGSESTLLDDTILEFRFNGATWIASVIGSVGTTL